MLLGKMLGIENNGFEWREKKFPYQRKSPTHFHLLTEYLIEQIKRHTNIKLKIS